MWARRDNDGRATIELDMDVLPVAPVAWRWSSPIPSMRETHAGIAFATVDVNKPSDVILFGAMRGRATLALLSRGSRKPIDELQCVVGNVSSSASNAAILFEGKSLPLEYQRRFNRTHTESADMQKDRSEAGHAEWVFASVRLRCPSLSPTQS